MPALLPLLSGSDVNTAAPHPTTAAQATTYCSRYCHYHAMPANNQAYFRQRPLYGCTIRTLSAGGGQAAYVLANLPVFPVCILLLLLRLTYTVLRDACVISRLSSTPDSFLSLLPRLGRLV